MSQATALVLGASSQVGVFAIPLLLRQGYRVVALSRHQAPQGFPSWPDLRWLRGDQNALEGLQPEVIVSAAPLGLAARCLERLAGIERMAVTSTTSVISKLNSPSAAEQQQVRGILDDEQCLRELCTQRGVQLALLRPTLVYGCGLDQNLSVLLRFIRRFGFCPLSSQANGQRQPLHAHDLALALVSALSNSPEEGLEGPVCGGSVLSYREMVTALFGVAGCRPRLLALPSGVLASAVGLLGSITGKQIGPNMVYRQSVDLVFDDAPVRAQLQLQPRPFQPAASDFRLPERQAWVQLAEGSPLWT